MGRELPYCGSRHSGQEPHPHSPNCASPIRGGGVENAVWRVRTVGFSTADRGFAPAAGERQHLPSTEGGLTSLASPPQTPLPHRLGRVRATVGLVGPHHERREIGGCGRDHTRCGGGASALPQSAASSREVASCLRAPCSWAPRAPPPRPTDPLPLGTPVPRRRHELPAAPPVGQQLHGQSAEWVHDRPAAPAASSATSLGRQPRGHTRFHDRHCREDLHGRTSGLSSSP